MPAVPLPPQGVPLPSTYTLQHSGLVATSSEDADGTDELTMLAFIATPEGKDYSVQAVDLGTTSTNTGAAAGGGPVYEGPAKNVVLITALIEDDDGNAEAAADELELLIELAASVASTMQGTDRLALLETMVDYTVALDAVGSTPDRAARSVVTTSLTASEWPGLWSADSTEVSGRHYKVAVPHAMGSGRYEFLLDVPANLPSMHTVRLSLSNFEHTARNTDRAHVGDVEVTASIGGKSHTMHDAPTGLRALERKVLSGDVELSVSAVVHYDIDYPKHVLRQCKPRPGLPARVVRERCRRAKRGFRAMHDLEEKEPLDLAGTGTTYTTTYSTRLGGFKPAANKKGKAKAQHGASNERAHSHPHSQGHRRAMGPRHAAGHEFLTPSCQEFGTALSGW